MITAAPLNPGTMDRRPTLRYPVPTRSASGSETVAWVETSAIWARWLPQNSREFVSAAQRHSELSGLLRIRYRADVGATWRVYLEGKLYALAGKPIEIGRREYLDLPLATVNPPASSLAPTQQAFEVALAEGDVEKAITFPSAFGTAPGTVQVTLVMPGGGETFYLAVRAGSITTTGCTVDLGAAVPASGYSLSVLVSQ